MESSDDTRDLVRRAFKWEGDRSELDQLVFRDLHEACVVLEEYKAVESAIRILLKKANLPTTHRCQCLFQLCDAAYTDGEAFYHFELGKMVLRPLMDLVKVHGFEDAHLQKLYDQCGWKQAYFRAWKRRQELKERHNMTYFEDSDEDSVISYDADAPPEQVLSSLNKNIAKTKVGHATPADGSLDEKIIRSKQPVSSNASTLHAQQPDPPVSVRPSLAESVAESKVEAVEAGRDEDVESKQSASLNTPTSNHQQPIVHGSEDAHQVNMTMSEEPAKALKNDVPAKVEDVSSPLRKHLTVPPSEEYDSYEDTIKAKSDRSFSPVAVAPEVMPGDLNYAENRDASGPQVLAAESGSHHQTTATKKGKAKESISSIETDPSILKAPTLAPPQPSLTPNKSPEATTKLDDQLRSGGEHAHESTVQSAVASAQRNDDSVQVESRGTNMYPSSTPTEQKSTSQGVTLMGVLEFRLRSRQGDKSQDNQQDSRKDDTTVRKVFRMLGPFFTRTSDQRPVSRRRSSFGWRRGSNKLATATGSQEGTPQARVDPPGGQKTPSPVPPQFQPY